jgi:hypothetical protein
VLFTGDTIARRPIQAVASFERQAGLDAEIACSTTANP